MVFCHHAARGVGATYLRHAVDGNPQGLEARPYAQGVRGAVGVGHRPLVGLQTEAVLPLRQKRLFGVLVGRAGLLAGKRIKPACLYKSIGLAPVRQFDGVRAMLHIQTGHQACAVNAVFGRADRHGRSIWGGGVGRVPQPAAAVGMAVQRGFELAVRCECRAQGDAPQFIIPQARTRKVGVITLRHISRRAIAAQGIGSPQRSAPVGVKIVPVVAQAIQHFQ